MKKSFVIDLARWERGELRLEELMAAHGSDRVIDLAETHAWVSFLATEPSHEPGPAWAAVAARLEPRPLHVPRRRVARFHRLAAATVAGFLLTPATAFALGDGTVGRIFTSGGAGTEEVADGPVRPPKARSVRLASVPTPSGNGTPAPAPAPDDVPVPSTAPPATTVVEAPPVAEAPRPRRYAVDAPAPAPAPPVESDVAEPAPPETVAPEPGAGGGDRVAAAPPVADDSGVDDGWNRRPPPDPAPVDNHPGVGIGHDGETGPPAWARGNGGAKPSKK